MIPRYTNAPFEGQPGCVSLAAGVLGPDHILFVILRSSPFVIPRYTPSPYEDSLVVSVLLLGFLVRTSDVKSAKIPAFQKSKKRFISLISGFQALNYKNEL